MAWEWMRRLTGTKSRGDANPTPRRSAPQRFRPTFDNLEDRRTPTVTLRAGFEGLRQGDTGTIQGSPPDTHLAVSPSALIEVVNTSMTLSLKDGTTLSTADMNTMFPVVDPAGLLFDPVVMYDDVSQRFVIAILELGGLSSTFHFAVSNTSTPTSFANGEWTENQTINMVTVDSLQSGGLNGVLWADYPRMGYNADGLFVTFNMFGFAGGYDRTRILAINKALAYDQQNATMFYNFIDRDDTNSTMVPVRMHEAPPDGVMYFAASSFTQPTAIRVTKVSNYFRANPGIQTTEITVPFTTRGNNPPAIQPTDGTIAIPNWYTVTTNDTRMLSAAWRGNRLVAAHTTVINSEAAVGWYEVDTKPSIPKLIQAGFIDAGPGSHTFMPAIDISATLDIGVTFVQISPTEYLSMYVTGRTQRDPKGQMQAPRQVRAGQVLLTDQGTYPPNPSFPVPIFPVLPPPPPVRTGDYGGLVVDPLNPNLFWAANEYASDHVLVDNWATFVQSFHVSPLIPNPIKTFSPLRWIFDPRTGNLTGTITVLNTTTTITGQLTLAILLPNASVGVVGVGGASSTRVGNTLFVTLNGPFTQNAPIRIPLVLSNPLRRPLGTFQLGVALGGIG